MVSTYTPNKGYEQPATGDYVGTWGPIPNTNFGVVDSNLAGVFAVSTTGGTTTLSASDASNLTYPVTGTLASNATLVFPDAGGFYIVYNGTTGAYTLTVKTLTGTGVTLVQGKRTLVYSDGANMNYANDASQDLTTGDLKWRWDTSALPGWVFCNGMTIGPTGSSATQRADNDTMALYLLLWAMGGVPIGGRGANAAADWAAAKPMPTPNLMARGVAGLDGMGGAAPSGLLTSTTITGGATTLGNSGGVQTITLDETQMPTHTHAATADYAGVHQHAMLYTIIQKGGGTGGTVGTIGSGGNSANTETAGSHTHTLVVQNTGGGGSHNNVQPTIMIPALIKL